MQNVTVQLLTYTGGCSDPNTPDGADQRISAATASAGSIPRSASGNYYVVQFIEPFASGSRRSSTTRRRPQRFSPTSLQPIEGTRFTAIDADWPMDLTAPTTRLRCPAPTTQSAGGWRRGPVSRHRSQRLTTRRQRSRQDLVSIDGTCRRGVHESDGHPKTAAHRSATGPWTVPATPRHRDCDVQGRRHQAITTSNAARNYPAGGGTITLSPTDGRRLRRREDPVAAHRACAPRGHR